MGLAAVLLATMGIALAGESHDTAQVDATATLGDDAYVAAYAIVGAHATIGDRTFIGQRTTIADAAGPSNATTIGVDGFIGRTVTIGSAVVVGSDLSLARSVTLGNGVTAGTGLAVGYGSVVAAGADLGTGVTIGSLVSVADAQIGDNVVMARGVTIGAGAVIEAGVVLGPEVTIGANAVIRANARIRKGAHIHADATVESGGRIGREVVVASHAVVRSSVTVRANSYVGTYQDVTESVPRTTDLPDLPPPVGNIVQAFNGRTWSDGQVAASCDEYRNPPAGYEYTGETGSGRYNIRPPQSGDFPVFCDMDTDGGGWTLAAKVDRHHGGASMSEPNGWFGLNSASGATRLLDDVSRDTSSVVSSHGAARLGALYQAGITQARFTLIAENDTAVQAEWYKAVVDDTFLRWFSSTPHTATQVCTNAAMTANCSTGDILAGNVTILDGMNLGQFGYSTAGAAIHMRMDNDPSGSFSAVCSSTLNNNGNLWPDSTEMHWGNGLEIWLR